MSTPPLHPETHPCLRCGKVIAAGWPFCSSECENLWLLEDPSYEEGS